MVRLDVGLFRGSNFLAIKLFSTEQTMVDPSGSAVMCGNQEGT